MTSKAGEARRCAPCGLLTTTHSCGRHIMADQILPHGALRAPQDSQHSQEQPFTGKSYTVTPSNVIRLQGSGRRVRRYTAMETFNQR